jgi:hypothetical protein
MQEVEARYVERRTVREHERIEALANFAELVIDMFESRKGRSVEACAMEEVQ